MRQMIVLVKKIYKTFPIFCCFQVDSPKESSDFEGGDGQKKSFPRFFRRKLVFRNW